MNAELVSGRVDGLCLAVIPGQVKVDTQASAGEVECIFAGLVHDHVGAAGEHEVQVIPRTTVHVVVARARVQNVVAVATK